MQAVNEPATASYRGRFAPSPTGPLHFGSLVAAAGSYLEARQQGGKWLVRIEDMDAPRNVPGAADNILRTLERLGLHWDEAVLYQSQHQAAYREALHTLKCNDMVYPCVCSRKEIADSTLRGIEGLIYPGTCRNGIAGATATAQAMWPYSWRVRTEAEAIVVEDALQGRISQSVEKEIGDFTVLRADGIFTYQIAVVVDDAFQGITHIVRGADLLLSTPRQIYLQRLLNLPTPAYGHLPIAIHASGEKLSKQTLAPLADLSNPAATVLRVLAFLEQNPPPELAGYDLDSVWQWATAHWDIRKLEGIKTRLAD